MAVVGPVSSRHRVIRAGAGTGKTHALVTRYLSLLAGLETGGTPVFPESLVAITFTEKAAQELKDRIQARLRVLVDADADGVARCEPALAAFAEERGLSLPRPDHWQTVLDRLGGACIGTFHAFGSRWLRAEPWRVGLSSRFEVLTEVETLALWEAAAWQVLRTHLIQKDAIWQLAKEYGTTGSPQSWGVIDGWIALARKSREFGFPMDRWVENYAPDVLQSAWQDCVQRLRQITEALWQERACWGATSQVLLADEAAWFLAWKGPSLDQWPPASETAASMDTFASLLGRLRAQAPHRDRLAALKEAARDILEEMPALQASSTVAPLASAFVQGCQETLACYQQSKQSKNQVDFADLLLFPVTWLRSDPHFRRRLQEQYVAFLVDESQDTNPLQTELLSWIVCGRPTFERNLAADASNGPALYLVGDWKQSIYQFRGADLAHFSHTTQAILEQGGVEETLRVSYRSHQRLIETMNALFSTTFAQQDVLDAAENISSWVWSSDKDALLALRDSLDEMPAAELLFSDPPLEDNADRRHVESKLAACRMRMLHQQGTPWSDMVILLRRWSEFAPFVQTLAQQGIPARVVGGQPFYHSDEVRDATWFLTLLGDPSNRFAWFVVLRSLFVGCSDTSLFRLSQRELLHPGKTVPEVLAKAWDVFSVEERGACEQLLHLYHALHPQREDQRASGCLNHLEHALELTALFEKVPSGVQRMANFHKLVGMAYTHEQQGGTFDAFVSLLHTRMGQEEAGLLREDPAFVEDADQQGVRLMTVHQSKGLEFPIVFLPGCVNREKQETQPFRYDPSIGLGLMVSQRGQGRIHTWPSWRIAQIQRQKNQQESARLFYVGVTRARERVVFVGEGRADQGTWRAWINRFLEEEGERHIRTIPIAVGKEDY